MVLTSNSSSYSLIVFVLQSFPKVAFAFELRRITGDGVIDQVVVKRLECQIRLNSVERIHLHAFVGETISRAKIFEFHAADWSNAEYHKHDKREKLVHFQNFSTFFSTEKKIFNCRLNSQNKLWFPMGSFSGFYSDSHLNSPLSLKNSCAE